MSNIKQLLNSIMVDPVNLSITSKLLSVVSCFTAILVVAWATHKFIGGASYPIIVASMGASAVIVFINPTSPLAQPWPLVGGQLLSAITGVFFAQVFANTVLAAAFAVGGSVLVMLLFRCLHPPGAATALTPVMAGNSVIAIGYGFVLVPVGLNVAILLVMAYVINRWLLRYEYPVLSRQADTKKQQDSGIIQTARTGVSVQDLQQALNNMDRFMDVSAGDLSKLLTDAQMLSFKRYRGNVSCGDIMVKPILAVEYGTEVEAAWKIMQSEKLKAMPVIDRAKHVIGIITWNDFFKFIDVAKHETFQEKFHAFIRRTPDVTTNKPESVGHIMTSKVSVLPEDAHIAELIPLMSSQGYRQVPIINTENRLVGMVYQANLIAALYIESHDAAARLDFGECPP